MKFLVGFVIQRRPRARIMVFVCIWVAVNVAMLSHPGVRYLGSLNHDWQALLKIHPLMQEGALYAREHWFVYAPLALWALAYVFTPLGYSWWLALHLASVAALGPRSLTLLALISVPFWVDTISGNVFVFVFAAGSAALMGSKTGAILTMALFALMPRPVAAPLIGWLLWKQPSARAPFVASAAIVIITSGLSGDLQDWAANMLAIGRTNYDHFANLGPTRLFGSLWLVVGVPLAGWLTLKGRVGLAGLAVSPYVSPGYVLVLLWEWIALSRSEPARNEAGSR